MLSFFFGGWQKLNGIGVPLLSSLRAHCGWLFACLSQCVVGLVWFGRIVGWLLPACLPVCLFGCVGTYIKEVRARLKNTIPVDPVRSSESDVLPASSRPRPLVTCIQLCEIELRFYNRHWQQLFCESRKKKKHGCCHDFSFEIQVTLFISISKVLKTKKKKSG